ncbi:MAG: RsmD family RNA methyltransferase [Acidimicrobiales bacterium]
MRVVGGQARGRRLRAPAGSGTRPTRDGVREAVFDMLGSLGELGRVEGAAVADLFAGSGALGIEALSRGAATAVFVDDDPRALAVVQANLGVLGTLPGRVEVVRSDVLGFLRRRGGAVGRAAGAAGAGAGSGGEPFDLVLCDPPYAFTGWAELFTLAPGRLVVAESGGPVDPGPGWAVLRWRRYGGSVVTLARPLATAPEKGTE